MEQVTAVEKSKVTVKVPKRFKTKTSPEFIEWQEFKLRSRVMPNGYTVSLAAVRTGNRILLGASACAPDDEFVKDTAFMRSIGRARQLAFEILSGSAGCRHSLMENYENGDRFHQFYYDGPDDHVSLLNEIRSYTKDLYALVAHNAEASAVRRQLSWLRKQHGYRFDFAIGCDELFTKDTK